MDKELAKYKSQEKTKQWQAKADREQSKLERQRITIQHSNRKEKSKNWKKFISRKEIEKRAKGTRAILSAIGAIENRGGNRTGAGRPSGTYKYGMPIHQYKKVLTQRRALYQSYSQRQNEQLTQRGFTPEQLQAVQIQRTQIEQQMPQQNNQSYSLQFTEQSQPVQFSRKALQEQGVAQAQRTADEEMNFRKFVAERTVSPRTQAMLDNLKRVQNKSRRDDIEMQRRVRERAMVAEAGNLIKARYIFNDHNMDMTGVSSENILNSPNIWKDNPNQINILKNSGRPGILSTIATGNNLKFF